MNIFRSYSQSPAKKNTVMPHRPRNKAQPWDKSLWNTEEEREKCSVQEWKESLLCEGKPNLICAKANIISLTGFGVVFF